jgi:imidazolonepropionase-like amidohydrolase
MTRNGNPIGTSLIVHARGLFLDPPGKVLADRSVVVEGGRIALVGTPDEASRAAPEATSVDLGELLLLPGLINTHVHLSFSGGQDPRADYYADRPETRLARAIHHGGVMLRSGVTTVRDCGSDWSLLALQQIADTGLFDLPNMVLCGPPITQTGGHLHQMGGEADGPEEIRKMVRRLHKQGATSIKVMATGGQMTPGTLPEKPTFGLDELRAAVETAAEYDQPTVAHVLASEGMRLAARAGFDSLEHCAFFGRAANGLLERGYDEAIAEEILQAGASAMIGVSAGYHTFDDHRGAAEVPNREAFLLQQEERMFRIVGRFVELGIPIVCGTDAGVRHTYFDETWLELELLVERAGLAPLEALRTATINAAHALKLGGTTGRIATGLRADFIAVAADPLEDPAALREVPWVMRRGEIVKQAGA